jgi:hypothetical protein
MAMADVRIDMETALYEQMAALCAKLGTTVEAVGGTVLRGIRADGRASCA